MKTELELRHLRVFAAVVEAGTRTRAAQALGLSQSTVSETLSALERAVGVALFRKAGAGALTAAGEVLLLYARRLDALTSELAGALAAASADVKATLSVAAVESVGAYLLPKHLAALRGRWPAVRVEVTTGNCAEIRERVAAGTCDLGLTLETEGVSDVGMVLARPRLLVVGVPTHALAARVASAEALGACDFYMCDAAGNYHQTLRHHFETAGVPLPRMQAMGTIEGVKRGLLEGGGALGLLPEHAVDSELREAALAEVRLRPALPVLELRAVRASGANPSPVADDLLASLRGGRASA